MLGHAGCTAFGLPPASTTVLHNTSENLTFKLTTPEGKSFALRVHRPGYQAIAAIQSELSWLAALARDTRLHVPRPVPGPDGALIQTLTDVATGAHHFAVLFHWEQGSEPQISDDLAHTFRTLGAQAAQLHAHARAWQRPPGFTRQRWDFAASIGSDKPLWGHWRDAQGMTPALEKLFTRTTALIGRRLAAYGEGAARFGLIHGDLRLANLLVDGTEVKVIDFDDCGFGWFMSDAATPVSFHEHEPQVPDLINHWVAGYRAVAPLAQADENEIPTFVMMRRLVLIAWLASRPDTPLSTQLGAGYTHATQGLAEDYLDRMG